jgi:hypothetical protein
MDKGVQIFTHKCELGSKIHKELGERIMMHLWDIIVHSFNRFVKLFSLTNHIAYTFFIVKDK